VTVELVAEERNKARFLRSCERLLDHLRVKGESSFSEIVSATGMSSKTVAKVLDYLELPTVRALERDDSSGRILHRVSGAPVLFRYIARVRHRLTTRKIKFVDGSTQVQRDIMGRFAETAREPPLPRFWLPKHVKLVKSRMKKKTRERLIHMAELNTTTEVTVSR
jgi:hypothetical protein